MQIPKLFARGFEEFGYSAVLQAWIVSELHSPHRHWHGMPHHAMMLEGFAAYDGPFRAELFAAIVFHDIVYEADREDNEERSAKKARDWLTGEVDIDLVAMAILASKTHRLGDYAADDGHQATILFFLRLDLAALWTEKRPLYETYAQGIRKEYAHAPNEVFRAGRAAVLGRLYDEIRPHMREQEGRYLGRNFEWEREALAQGKLDL